MNRQNGAEEPLLSEFQGAEEWRVCNLDENAEKSAEQSRAMRKLSVAIVLCSVFMVVELVGGYLASSLAIMSDAAHLFSDIAGFAISLVALRVAQMKSRTMTYGLVRAEVLGALLSTLTIWLVTGVLVWKAIQRIITPEEVDGKLMFCIACIGVFVNVCLFFVLGEMGHSHGIGGGCDHGHGHSDHGHGHGHSDHGHGHGHSDHGHGHSHSDHGHGHGHSDHGNGHGHSDHSHHEVEHGHGHDEESGCNEHEVRGHERISDGGNMNLRSAWLHAIGDLLQNIGVMIAAALIWYNPDWRIADPIATLLFSILVLWTTKAVMSDILNVLMMSVPAGKDPAEIASMISKVEGVDRVYDMHIWSLTSGVPILTVHITCSAGADCSRTVHEVQAVIKAMGIEHCTIQANLHHNEEL